MNMTWPDVAALAIIFLGMALVFWVFSRMVRSEDSETILSRNYTHSEETETPIQRMTRRFADSYRPGRTWKVTKTTTTTTYTAPEPTKPEPNPKPLVTPPPADKQPN